MSSADNLCKQFGPRAGLTKCQACSGSNCLTLWWYSWKNFLKMLILKISADNIFFLKNYPACKAFMTDIIWKDNLISLHKWASTWDNDIYSQMHWVLLSKCIYGCSSLIRLISCGQVDMTFVKAAWQLKIVLGFLTSDSKLAVDR